MKLEWIGDFGIYEGKSRASVTPTQNGRVMWKVFGPVLGEVPLDAGIVDPGPNAVDEAKAAAESALQPPPRDSLDVEAERLDEQLSRIRSQGWAVAVHNDYRLNGTLHTFWLFTKGDRCVKGEGRSDVEALAAVRVLLGQDKPAAPATSDRYFVDERAGCIAVRDRNETDPEYQGLHHDTAGVVWFQMGQQATDGWGITDMQRAAARRRCQELNAAPTPTPDATPDDAAAFAEQVIYTVDGMACVGSGKKVADYFGLFLHRPSHFSLGHEVACARRGIAAALRDRDRERDARIAEAHNAKLLAAFIDAGGDGKLLDRLMTAVKGAK